MKCPNCGTELNNNETFCTNCGKRVDGAIDTPTGVETSNTNTENEVEQPVQQATQPVATNTTKYNSTVITGFVIAIISLFFYPIILGSVAAVLSAIGLKQVNETNEKGKGLAIAGIIIGIAVIIIMVIGYATGIVRAS